MHPPKQPVDRRRALRHKIFPTIHQQLQLTRHLVMRSDRKIGFTQKRPRHRQRIDRIGFTPGTCRGPHLSHQLRRHPHHLLTGREQVALQPRRQMPAILDRPHHLGPETFTSPHHRLGMPDTGRRNDLLPDLAPSPIHRNKRVRALVNIGPNNNHGGCLLHCEVTVGPVGGHISVGAMPRSYQVTPAGPSHLMPTKRMNANPTSGTEPTSQTPGDQDPTTAPRGNLTLTLRRAYRPKLVPSMCTKPTHHPRSADCSLRKTPKVT